MKIETYQYPHSSFLSCEKDMAIISNMMIKNNNLKKLLYYTSKDCMNRPNLTEEQTLELFGKNIKIVPKIYVDNENLVYVLVRMLNFTANSDNPEFRDNIIEFDIICHYDQWMLKDFEQRPYRIAGEIDTLFNKRHLTGIGTLQFLAATQLILTDEFGGFCVQYEAIHGEEDKKNAPNPINQEELELNFNNIFNND